MSIISDEYCWMCGLHISETTHYGVGGIIVPKCMSKRTLSLVKTPRYRDCFKIEEGYMRIARFLMAAKRERLLDDII